MHINFQTLLKRFLALSTKFLIAEIGCFHSVCGIKTAESIHEKCGFGVGELRPCSAPP